MVYSEIRRGKRIGFFGIGMSNVSLMRCLPLSGCEITIRTEGKFDPRSVPDHIRPRRIYEGNAAFCDIDEDILIFSPSVRREREEFNRARDRGVIFTSDAELFFELCKKPVLCVTGSDGKSTTATLIYKILSESGYNARLIGNIGCPMVESIDPAVDIYVAELSSFMLRYANPTAERACLTGLTPNHLDWHESLLEYKKTKINLLKSSKKFVISDDNTDILGAYGIISSDRYSHLSHRYSAGLYITEEKGYICKNGEMLLPTDRLGAKEGHNVKNLMMAIAMTDGYTDIGAIERTAIKFTGLPHRCELIHSEDGVDYIDSSIDSSPARTMTTLLSMKKSVVLILGGKSKGLDYAILSDAVQGRAAAVIITGENADEICSALGASVPIEIIPDFDSAVIRGCEIVKSGEALLLSPASTSYDRFKNYAERGDRFKEIIKSIKQR